MEGEAIRGAAASAARAAPRRPRRPLASRRPLAPPPQPPPLFFASGLRRASASDLFGNLRISSNSPPLPSSSSLQRKPKLSVVAMAADG